MTWPCFHRGCLGEGSSEGHSFHEQTTDTRHPLLTVKNSQKVLSDPEFLAALSNLSAFLYQVPISHCAPSLPKTSTEGRQHPFG